MCSDGEPQRLSPELGNVCFASSLNAWCFTLESFAKVCTEHACLAVWLFYQ